MIKKASTSAIALLMGSGLGPAQAGSDEDIILDAMDGNSRSQFTVGQWYESGTGPVMPDIREAYICYYLAAAQGHEKATQRQKSIEQNHTYQWVTEAREEAKKYGCGAAALMGCYITTAVCERLNKPDDCRELRVLRAYRDQVLAQSREGRRDIQTYYEVSPRIVEAIANESAPRAFYSHLLERHILPAVKAVETQRFDEAYGIYRAMTLGLEARFLK